MQHKDDRKKATKKTEDIKDWRDEHGRPNLSFLQSLANNENPRSFEKLKAIAQDLDVNYSPGTSTEELLHMILSEVRSDPTTTT